MSLTSLETGEEIKIIENISSPNWITYIDLKEIHKLLEFLPFNENWGLLHLCFNVDFLKRELLLFLIKLGMSPD